MLSVVISCHPSLSTRKIADRAELMREPLLWPASAWLIALSFLPCWAGCCCKGATLSSVHFLEGISCAMGTFGTPACCVAWVGSILSLKFGPAGRRICWTFETDLFFFVPRPPETTILKSLVLIHLNARIEFLSSSSINLHLSTIITDDSLLSMTNHYYALSVIHRVQLSSIIIV